MYKVAICEDEPSALHSAGDLCKEILNELAVEHEISLFSSAESLETALHEFADPFHLLILDIQLEKKSGLTLAKELYARSCEMGIIFMTNHGYYAQESYDVHPIHFLSKPLERGRLEESIKIDLKRKLMPDTVVLNYGRKMTSLSTRDVRYIESRNHHIFIHKEGKVQEIRFPLSQLQASLPSRFQRCHASYLVNMEYISECNKTSVVLLDGTKLPVSRTYADQFATAYLRYFNAYLS